jgi:imidazole glycerol phosphate synthase subunit HisF
VVTGFGSVFVDGVEIEDAKASVVAENANGSTSNSVLQMGQSVRVDHDGKGTASKVTVDAAVVGAVSSIDTTALTLTVAAQKVLINNDANTGPVTVWAGGYNSLSDVLTTDLVEVHGSPVYDAATSSYKLVATRIQKMSAISSLKVNGKISNLDPTAKTFKLNGLTVAYASAVLRPSAATLANDVLVTAYGPTSGLSGTTLTANNLKINRLQNSTATDTTAQVGGPVSLYNSAAKTFEIQGVKVGISSSAVVTPSGASIANNAYVKVSGTVGSDGSLTPKRLRAGSFAFPSFASKSNDGFSTSMSSVPPYRSVFGSS